MSKEDCGKTACKQRFKGIENFLKRVAFNLGNTPSQTEVKIISCIPIDVTDLQQKIVHLEKQLDEAKGGKSGVCSPSPPATKVVKQPKQSCGPKRTSINTALLEPGFPCVSTAGISCKSLDCDKSTSPGCLNPKNKSNVSFIFPEMNMNEDLIDSNENSYTSQDGTGRHYNIDPYDIENLARMNEPKPKEHRRNFFRKKKKLLRNKKSKSPYIYYAQTNGSPFTRSVTEEVPEENSHFMDRSYLAKMINKQYKPKLLGDNLSLMSQFSSPVCRDVQSHCDGSCRYESDICSCCHGPFQNIDHHMGKINSQTYMVNEINTGNAYYDTNQYDLVPVKENPLKNKKDSEMSRKKEPRPHIDIKCWPENIRTKYRYLTVYPPPINYQGARLRNDYICRDSFVRRMPHKLSRMDPITRKVVKRRREMYKRERPVKIETSKSCSIDFGSVYPKRNPRKPTKHESLHPIPVPQINAECLNTVINNSECQTVLDNLEEKSTDAKTEATLNQIKSILQSVLAEVKVSSQTRNHIVENKSKKDAVVQKGASQSNMQTSSLMNSITYSPYAMPTNPYIASCSRPLSPNQFCIPPSPMKCFQNFPLFIQSPARHICTSCYRNSSHVKSNYLKQGTTIATNTDSVREDRSKETEKLIKEIYKSMALTMDIPNKDTSLSEYEDVMKSVHGFGSPMIVKTEPKKQPKKIRNVVQAVSELFLKKDIIETSDTPNTTFESKLPSNDASTGSNVMTTDTEERFKKNRLEKYLRARNMQAAVAEAEKRAFREAVLRKPPTLTESETSSSEAESDTTLVMKKEAHEPKVKKEKQGLFSKMFKSVKLFKPRERARKKEEKAESEEETSSDSDDYQTIYSQKIDNTVKHKNRSHLPKRKTHSKISYKQTYQRDRSPEKKRSPYMEQEYRRYWNERLMFHDDKPRHSSEQMYSEQTTPQKSAYYQTFEARSALVDPKKSAKTEARIARSRGNDNEGKQNRKLSSKGMAWLKKHKMGIHCGEQWKKFILEG